MLPVAEQEHIDGVPVLRADLPVDRAVACLMFRVGRFDETLPAAGITHAVEHLALVDKTDAPYSFNASVNGRFTAFYLETGEPSQVSGFVSDVCRGLVADRAAVLDRERRILRIEAASRGGAGALGTCLAERYGATGPGLANYEEFGLYNLGWDDVRAWRSRWFTAGNAVLWIAGPWPDGLRIDLPAGSPPPHEPLHPVAVDLPGFVITGAGGIGVSSVARRSVCWHACVEIAQRQLTQVLRHESGLSYQVQAAVEDLGDGLMHTWLAADTLPEQLPAATHKLLSTVEGLVADGCPQTELKAYFERLASRYSSPSGPPGILSRQAQAILAGQQWSAQAMLDAAAELTPEMISQVAGEMHDSMIVAAPGAPPALSGRMGRLPLWSEQTITGARHKSVDSGGVLTTGTDGIMLTSESKHNVTVRYADAAALLQWSDGKLAVIGTDGFAIQLDPGEWPDGTGLAAQVASKVPAELTVRIDAPGARRTGRQASATDGGSAASSPSRPAARRLARTSLWFYLVLVVGGIAVIATGPVGGGIVPLAVGLTGLGRLEYWRRRRERNAQASR